VQLFDELQRRNVVRVTIGYIVSSWLLIQVADLVLENIGSPKWVIQSIMLVLALGFPVVVFFSWAYEVTPEGIRRESEIDRSQSITHVTGRKLDRAIMAVLVVALGYFAFDKYVLSDDPEAAVAEPIAAEADAPTPTSPAVAEGAVADMGKSIAVLPFVNMSADKSSEYFSDGLADTVLHMLAQNRELRVAARTSSFQFRDQAMDIAAIGNQLNVGAVLEGSVQRAGDKIRVTAQLIDVSNGYHLWSGNFDRQLDDVFAIQDEIASEVVSALKLSLLGDSGDPISTDDTDNIDAYTEFLLAVNDLGSPNTETLPSAAGHLEKAVLLDPNYARAHSSLGRVYLEMEGYGLMSTTEALVAARNSASRALDIAPTSSEALAVLGLADLEDGKLQSAGELLAQAIKNGPSDVIALQYFASFLAADARPAEAAETYRKVIRLDPLSENPYIGLAGLLSSEKKFSEAHELVAKRLEMGADSPSLRASQSDNELAQGNLAAATRIMIEAHNLDPDDADMPAIVGRYYLALDMPTEARRWFDRAVEIDSQHPLSQSAPLFLNYYLQQDENEIFQIARQLLENGIDNRQSSRFMALLVLVEYAAKTDRNDIALEVLDNLYPNLFDDPPTDLARDTAATFFAGMALMQSGDVERGTHLLQFYVDYQSRYDDVYRVNRSTLAGHLLLGDTDSAKEKLPAFVENRYYWEMNRMLLEHSSLFDPLREEPAFVQMLDDYKREAEEQRTLLQASANAP
jgi:TolB-like protein/Flp pilus assembly protein TadD